MASIALTASDTTASTQPMQTGNWTDSDGFDRSFHALSLLRPPDGTETASKIAVVSG